MASVPQDHKSEGKVEAVKNQWNLEHLMIDMM